MSNLSEDSKSSTHYLSDTNRFDVSSTNFRRRAFARNVESVDCLYRLGNESNFCCLLMLLSATYTGQVLMSNLPCFTFFRRQKTNKPSMIKLKTTEEMEMECIAKLRKQTKHHIKVNENSMKKAILCPSVNAVRASATTLTRPQEFHFQTDKRLKQHPMTTRTDQQHDLNGEDCEKGFRNSLRQHPPSPVRNTL